MTTRTDLQRLALWKAFSAAADSLRLEHQACAGFEVDERFDLPDGSRVAVVVQEPKVTASEAKALLEQIRLLHPSVEQHVMGPAFTKATVDQLSDSPDPECRAVASMVRGLLAEKREEQRLAGKGIAVQYTIPDDIIANVRGELVSVADQLYPVEEPVLAMATQEAASPQARMLPVDEAKPSTLDPTTALLAGLL